MKRLFVLLLALLVPGTALAAGLPFKDIGNVPWANHAIQDMSSKGIVQGIGGGKFGPMERVSPLQVLVMEYRVLKSHHMLLTTNAPIVGSIAAGMDAAAIPGWGKNAFVYFDSRGEIAGGDAAVHVADATRAWTAAEVAMGLGIVSPSSVTQMTEEGRLAGKYADAAEIPAGDALGVYQCSDFHLLTGEPGPDGKTYFKPNGNLTRAQAVVILDRVDSLLSSGSH